ncbi:MAG: hypothetical protein H8E21_05645 [Gammaproteobacteria bacterium]|nr:hypothetical protein [Gammaproteobacteria bacterium]
MSERRKQLYTDREIQGYLLLALIIMELVLVGLLLFFMYQGIDQIIEQQLYQIHRKGADSSWVSIFMLTGWMMGGFLLVNLIALYLANVIWGRYIRKTVTDFSKRLDKLQRRDFSNSEQDAENSHRMIDLMDQWLLKEKNRSHEIALIVEQLSSPEYKALTSSDRQQLQQYLQKYRRLLTGN